MPDEERRSNWTAADHLDLDTLRLILIHARRLYEASSFDPQLRVWPTATSVRAALRKPS